MDKLIKCPDCGNTFNLQDPPHVCYGLEGQWEPEETSIEAIKMRPLDYGARRIAAEFIEALR